jgi:hypothetical protein
MGENSPKAQMSGCRAALIRQRVEDNAFHLEDDDRIPDADEVFDPRGIPVC